MARGRLSNIVQQLRQTVRLPGDADLNDGQLLGGFVERQDEAAFAALVRRHGAMVLNVCRRVLDNHHDAEDAFQATFLVLVRKAHSISPRQMVGNWLYGVAYQTALKARARAVKRRGRERQVTDMPEPHTSPHDPHLWHDLQTLLDQELSRLADKYRVPIVLCDLEGKSRKDASRQLGWTEGTLSGRLARARKMLAERLARRGVVVSGGLLAGLLGQQAASACVPAALEVATVKAATAIAAGQAAGAIAPSVAALMEGVLKAMLLTKLKITTTALFAVLALGLLAFSVGQGLMPTATGAAIDDEVSQALPRAERVKADSAPTVQVLIGSPPGMRITTLAVKEKGKSVHLEAPGRLNLESGRVTHMKLTDIPNRPGCEFYPSFEIPIVNKVTDLFVTHNAVPIDFTDADFERSIRNEAVIKAVYLASGTNQPDFPLGKVVTLASYERPGKDVIKEAARRGTILAIVRIGANIPAVPAIQKGPPTVKEPLVPPVQIRLPSPDAAAEVKTIILDNCRIVLQPGNKLTIKPTPNGVRLEIPGVTVEVPRLTIETEKQIQFIEGSGGRDLRVSYFEISKSKIGEIIIIGNEKVSDAEIRKQLPFYPGGPLDFPELKHAERNLTKLNLDCTVQVVDPPAGNRIFDIIIKVKEK